MIYLNQVLFKYYESLGICYILYYLDMHQKELKSIQPLFLNPGARLLFVGRSIFYKYFAIFNSWNSSWAIRACFRVRIWFSQRQPFDACSKSKHVKLLSEFGISMLQIKSSSLPMMFHRRRTRNEELYLSPELSRHPFSFNGCLQLCY